MQLFAPHAIDMYKHGHAKQYYKYTSLVYSNVTARSGKHSNIKNSKGIVVMGIQLMLKDYLIDSWNQTFFSQPEEKVIKKYQRRMSNTLQRQVSVEEMRELHQLGYLPIEIKALPEGSFVPYKVPFITVFNTIKDPKWKWVTNYIDCVLNQEIWPMVTSATTMREYLRVFYLYAHHTCDDDSFVKYQGHDFSYRGMQGKEAAAKSGFAVIATGTVGSDTVYASDIAEDYYNANSDEELIACSVDATEHSVMCSNINIIENSPEMAALQKEFFDRLPRKAVDEINDPNSNININKLVAEYAYVKKIITEIYPNGNISIVADSYDFWAFVKYILLALKAEILLRDGKVIVRPDSGDPVDIICGTFINKIWTGWGGSVEVNSYNSLEEIAEQIIQYVEDDYIVDTLYKIDENDDRIFYKLVTYKNKSYKLYFKITDTYYANIESVFNDFNDEKISSCELHKIEEYFPDVEEMGLVESLYKIFGGKINSKGYIELNPKVGAIYGDSITLERQESILSRLKQKEFASNNIVLGIGSFTFAYVTRDTGSIAMKATYCEVMDEYKNIIRIPIAKDPKTDAGKKSAKGLLMVERSGDKYSLRDECNWAEESRGCLETVFRNGKIIKETSLKEIRERVKKELDAELENIRRME